MFHNDGNGKFTESALASGVALRADGREQAGMGVDVGDYDNDGNLDLVLTTFSDDYKTMFHNDGTGHFEDVSFPGRIGAVHFEPARLGCSIRGYE